MLNTILAGKYRVMQAIGDGGMAVVYRVEEVASGKSWALKVLHISENDSVELDEARRMFQQEAKMLAQLEHHHLPKVVDYFEQGEQSYLVMEFIAGKTLQKHLATANSALPEKPVLRWMVQICEVLDYLHGQPKPIIFRDLKPDNIMLSNNGLIKLIDFGIARTYKPKKKKDTVRMGSANYAPLEQWGKGQTDARSDLYALGATMYHLLTNIPPPLASEPSLTAPTRLNPALSSETEELILKAMQQKKEDRYQSAKEMQKALEDCLIHLGLSPVVHPVPIAPLPPIVRPKPSASAACPACGHTNRQGAHFCGQCGRPRCVSEQLQAMLNIMQSGTLIQSQSVSKSPFLIGRESTQDGFVPDLNLLSYDAQFVSRRHAQITHQGKQFGITDLGSANGTFVNRKALVPHVTQVIRSGDRIRIGQVHLIFRLTV